MKLTKAKLQTLHRIWTLMNDSGKKKKKKQSFYFILNPSGCMIDNLQR